MPVSPLALVSLLFGGLPWLLPSVSGLLFGLGIHVVWFLACEWLVRRPAIAAVPTERAERPASRVMAQTSPGTAPRSLKETNSGPERARPKTFVHVPILAALDETADIKTIRVARPEGFEFEAGQFLTVRVRVDGKEYARCYSISSAPDVRGYLEISVKRQGTVSNALHATVRPGGTLAVKSPAGAFRYPQGDDRPIVLLAGGIGVTPLMSMLRHALSTEPARPVALIYSVHTEADFAFIDEIESAARRHPQLRVQLAATRGSTRPCVYPGRIDEDLLRATVPQLPHSIAFICGPAPMIDGMKTLLTKLGVPAGQIRHEVFQAAVAAAAGLLQDRDTSAVEVAAGSHADVAPHARAEKAGRSAGGSGATRWMVCSRTGKKVAMRRGQTLLEAAEDGGVAIDSLCRAGVCGTCRLQVSAGEVECESDTLAADERSQGFVLACVTTASTDCTVDL